MAARRSAKWRREWTRMSAWTPSEFTQLCLGWAADGRFEDAELYNVTFQKIERAIRTKDPSLPTIDLRWPETNAEAIYGGAPLFRPAEVWRWAHERFPRFPFREDDFAAAPAAGDSVLPERLRKLVEIARQISVGNRSGVPQKQIADEIKKAVGVKLREAEALAALIRRDEDVKSDRRAARRRT
jgi:hypothetical protein